MAQQNSPLTRSNMNQATSVSPLGHESSPKNDISCSLLTRKPFFFVALGSSIIPSDLCAAGFTMENFGFSPSNFYEVCQLLSGFIVVDESVNEKKVYRIDRESN